MITKLKKMFDNNIDDNGSNSNDDKAITPSPEELLHEELGQYKVNDSDINLKNIYVKTALSITKNAFDYRTMYKYMVFAETKGIPFTDFLYYIAGKFSDEKSFLDKLAKRISYKEKSRRKLLHKMSKHSDLKRRTLSKYIDKIGCTATQFYMMGWHQLTASELDVIVKDTEKQNAERIETALEKSGMTAEQLRQHMRHCYETFGIDEDSYYPYACWEVDDEILSNYLSNGMSQCMRAYYNENKGNGILANKSKFNEFFAKYVGRECWESSSKDYDSFRTFIDGRDKVIIKPLSLMSGKGIKIIDIDEKTDIDALYEMFVTGPNVLVEEVIKQHPEMAKVYGGSVNTVRLVTVQNGDNAEILTGYVRFGVEGHVDNFGAGGVTCRLDADTGVITTKAVGKGGRYYERHPISNVEFKGLQIPLWDEVRKIAQDAIKEYSFINYAGWDIAICEDKVLIVEGNSWPGVDTGRHKDPEFPGRKHLFDGVLPFEK